MNSERSVQGFPTIEEGPYVGSCAILATKPLTAGLGHVLPRGFLQSVCSQSKPSPPSDKVEGEAVATALPRNGEVHGAMR